MKRNALKDTLDHQTIRPAKSGDVLDQRTDEVACDTSDIAFFEICELLDQGDEKAANDTFDESYLVICETLNKVDYETAGHIFDEEFTDIRELRSRLRQILMQGLCWTAVTLCLILTSFAILTP